MPGKLVLVGTPIGNLSDFSPRGVEALKSADVILCEDTRHTRKLLTHFGIETPSESYHEHNEDEKAPRLIERLERGATLALVSDAGMPVVSDPGYRIARLAREHGIAIEPIPGPFAGVLALVASGLPPHPFTFLDSRRTARDSGAISIALPRNSDTRWSSMRRRSASSRRSKMPANHSATPMWP